MRIKLKIIMRIIIKDNKIMILMRTKKKKNLKIKETRKIMIKMMEMIMVMIHPVVMMIVTLSDTHQIFLVIRLLLLVLIIQNSKIRNNNKKIKMFNLKVDQGKAFRLEAIIENQHLVNLKINK